MTNYWMVLGFTSLGMIPLAITVVWVEKQERLLRKSAYFFVFSLGLIFATSAIYHWVGECTFVEAAAMQKSCGTTLLPPKSIPIFYGGAILASLVIFFSVIKVLQQKSSSGR